MSSQHKALNEMQNIQNMSAHFLSRFSLRPYVPLSQSPHPTELAPGLHGTLSGRTLPEFLWLPPNTIHYGQSVTPNIPASLIFCYVSAIAASYGKYWTLGFGGHSSKWVGRKKNPLYFCLLTKIA